jgi:hypothetical protein
MSVLRAIVLVLAWVAVVPGTALAAPARIASDQAGVSAIALQGDEVVWTAGGRLYRRTADGRIHKVRRVEQFNRSEPGSFYASGSRVVHMDVSGSTAVVVENFWDELASKLGDRDMGSVAYLVDLAGGGRTIIEPCATHGDAALAGSVLVTSGCAGEEAGVQLRDLAHPAEPPQKLADAAAAVRAAGRAVAWLTGRRITVMDVDGGTRREIDIAPFVPADEPGLPPTPVVWALDGDGGVALASSAGVVLAPADGSAPQSIAALEGITAVTFTGATGVGVVVGPSLLSGGFEGLGQVMTVSRDGSRRVLARGGWNSALDADGGRLAYSSLACHPSTFDLWIQTAEDVGTADVSRKRCPLALRGEGTISRRGRVSYTVDCPILIPSPSRTERCTVTVRARVGHHGLGLRRTPSSAGDSADLRWRVPQRLRGTRRMHVKVTVKMRGRVLRRSRTVRLLRD